MFDIEGLAAHLAEHHDMRLMLYQVLEGTRYEHWAANGRGRTDNRFVSERGSTPTEALTALGLNLGFISAGVDGLRVGDAQAFAGWRDVVG